MPVPSHTTRPLHEGMSGAVTVSVTAFQAGDPKFQRGGGQSGNRGMRLADLRKQFGGDEGDVMDPHLGQKHHVSLKQWANSDPGTTYLEIQFRFAPGAPMKGSQQP